MPNELADILTLHFAEVEEVKLEGKDFIFDIDVRPNRAGDCFSHLGVAREISAILSYKLNIPKIKLEEDKKLNTRDFIRVEVKNTSSCKRYAARILVGMEVGPSPSHIRERLEVCGLRPINNIVDILNYVMLETGQPLHAFDIEKISGRKIIVRFAKDGEKIITLDGEEHKLSSGVLAIADAKKPIAIAGIKGGKLPEINRLTKTVVLESANFNPSIIRRGSQNLNLRTDASLRFEHGLDQNLAEFAINRAAAMIQEIAGGKVARGLIDFYPRKVLPKKILMDLNRVKDLLGIEIPKKEIIKILNNLGLETKERRAGTLEVLVPTRRQDINLTEDLIEDIGRIYGYEKIPATLALGALVSPKRNENIFWRDLAKNFLKEAGFSEVYNYSFVGEQEAEVFGYGAKNLAELENPLSANQKYLRPSLICNLLKNAKENLKFFEELKIFESGKIFYNNKSKIGEKLMLAGIMAKKKNEGRELFFEAKGIMDLMFNNFGISGVWYDEYKPTPEDSKFSFWNKEKCAEIKIGEKGEVGFLGEINPVLSRDLGINVSMVAFDLDFEKLQKFVSEEREYEPISPHPAAIRDIAILVPQGVLVDEVLEKIEVAGGKLVRDVDLFDMYEGEEIGEGKKNLAFHVIFQAEDRTLRPEEINSAFGKIIKTMEEMEWEVRK